jgi:hypothetical protein
MLGDTHRHVLLGAVLALTLLALVAVPAVGTPTPTPNVSERAPYYADNNSIVDNQAWMDDRQDPTLDNVTHYLTRVGGFVIGSETSGGGGAAGVLALALVLGGIVLGTFVGNGVGPVGGGVLGLVGVAGLAGAGLMPTWLFATALFGIGLVLTAAVIRVLR